ncbi:MAG: ArnT family glycosyltransferase [Bacteroidales bacterium]
MKKIIVKISPYLLFLPYLILFTIWVLISQTKGTFGDEGRYLLYAHNLIHGFYSPPVPDINLSNGPGYPLLLVPFIVLKFPLISITLLNALFYYFSIIVIFKALKEIVSFGMALAFSLVWASYYIAYQSIPLIHTETFTYLLISILAFSVLKAFKPENLSNVKKYVLLSGFILGYIVLTKMIFGYVLLIMTAGSGLLWIFNRNSLNYRKGIIILLVALLTTVPYLLYTYHLTGKIFCWGTGNSSLYWMSTPFEGEYGDWKGNLKLNPSINGNYNIQGSDSILRAHHKADFEEIYKYKGIEREDVYKRLAIRNIISHPIRYAENVIYNIGRLVFHFPFSQAIQRPIILLILPLNGILLTLILYSLIPTIVNWREIPMSVRFLLILVILYLGGSVLLSAYVRMFTVIVPILLLWIAFVLQNTLLIKLKYDKKPSLEP